MRWNRADGRGLRRGRLGCVFLAEVQMKSESKNDEIRAAVRDRYGDIARAGQATAPAAAPCCGPAPARPTTGRAAAPAASCCGPAVNESASLKLGYTAADIDAVPEGADLGLGCGNPQAIAALRPGERVLDLGSGAGFDCFLAARAVGPTGSVVGVDMTPDMLSRARENAKKTSLPNVEFRLGEIEHLPLPD